MTKIQRLHHAAYRCKDSEETRAFYEDFLGLPLTDAFEITTTATGRQASALVGVGSCRQGKFPTHLVDCPRGWRNGCGPQCPDRRGLDLLWPVQHGMALDEDAEQYP